MTAWVFLPWALFALALLAWYVRWEYRLMQERLRRLRAMTEFRPRVYAMDDCDWYAGMSRESVLAQFVTDTGIPASDLDDDCPRLLSDREMRHFKFYDEEANTTRTFAEQLERMIQGGAQFPCLFASTEY